MAIIGCPAKRVRVAVKGFRVKWLVLVTTLLDAGLYTKAEIAKAFRCRWHAELDIRAIKPFRKYGKSGMELGELVPHIGSIADDICVVRSMNTEAVNHAPGVTFFLTGAQVPGRPRNLGT